MAGVTHRAHKPDLPLLKRNQAVDLWIRPESHRNLPTNFPEEANNIVRARKPARLPVVMTRDEVRALLAHLDGREWLLTALLYGTGMRLMECIRLRVKDVEFDGLRILVHDGKGGRTGQHCSRRLWSSRCVDSLLMRNPCTMLTLAMASWQYNSVLYW